MARTETIDRCLIRLRLLCVSGNKLSPDEGIALRNLFIEDLADIDDQLLTVAVEQWTAAADRPFFPTPGQIRQLAYRLVTIDQPDGAGAWAILKEAMRRTHLDIDPIPELPRRVRLAVDAIGWRNLMTQTMQEEIGNRAHFIKLYDALAAREAEIATMKPEVRAQLEEIRKRLQSNALGAPEARKRLTGGEP